MEGDSQDGIWERIIDRGEIEKGEMKKESHRSNNPPKWPLRFFRWFCDPTCEEDIEGDLLERFQGLVVAHGPRKARRKYAWEVIRLFRPGIIKPIPLNNSYIHPAMIKHNFLVAFRSNMRNKGTFLINLIGLSTGLACVVLIGLWVLAELSVDQFHVNDTQLYQVKNHLHFDNGIQTTHESSGRMAEVLQADYPELKYVTAVAPSNWYDFSKLTLTVGEKDVNAAGQFVGKDYFHLFSFELVEGSPDYVLADKNSVVISESLARSLFNTTQDIIGKEIELQHEQTLLVSGIFKGTPQYSTIQFDFVMSFELCKEMYPWIETWNLGPLVYAVVEEGTSIEKFNQELANIPIRQFNDSTRQPFLAHFSSQYLQGSYKEGVVVGGKMQHVKLFSLVALFILLIACINFMNLSTARASRRLKEIGVKKAIGATRKMLITQYFSESSFMALLSLVISLILVAIFLPEFNQVTGKKLSFPFDPIILASILGVAVLSGILAGSYPALYLSKFDAIQVIKGKLVSSFGDAWLRKGLVIFQFTISLIFIVGIMIVYSQMNFLQQAEVGYEKDQVVCFDIQGRVAEDRVAFLNELRRIPGVLNASATSHDMSGSSWYFWDNLHWEDSPPNPDEKIRIELAGVDFGLIETLGLEMATGRPFSSEFRTDSSQLILNEAAVAAMGQKEKVIGQTVYFDGNAGQQVVGVVKNFHFESLHEEVKPMMLFIAPSALKYIMVRIASGKEEETVDKLTDFYAEFNPGFTFSYKFLDEDYQAFYSSEKRLASLTKYFAGLAILISCLGILGLAAFMAERRQKEIGIRKILGSDIWGLIQLLTKDFTFMVLIGIVIGLPISYFFAQNWLENFAFKIDLGIGYFLGGAAITLCIAWLTVAMQTYKAARLNPVSCLQDE